MIQSIDAFFLESRRHPSADCFCIYHRPWGSVVRGAILYVHPFAEEMNKGRQMAARQSRLFAEQGYAVLQIDLTGCGDSSGIFGSASWFDWCSDVKQASDWLSAKHPGAPFWFWGLRTGCLLASASAALAHQLEPNFIFWQPQLNGKTQLQQFLRLRIASDLLDGKARGQMQTLKQNLAAGHAVDVAGYVLSSNLASGLAAASLDPAPNGAQVIWLELSMRADSGLSTASSRAIQDWRSAGYQVQAHMVHGPAFWQSAEIEMAPALIEASIASLRLVSGAGSDA